ncbi:hypothetical protein [Pedobacter aquatilis]|uniref:hypothetical protein n=1 Tax=Pedobacter aquatilis TaxID=351343 RepID=UPI00292DC0F6|nr:hypothetical protein [Pedobacter aquatilis]
MALAYINISAKQYFNFMCKTDFERRIFHDSYKEFQKKSKVFSLNNTLHTFQQMLKENEKANTLHQKLNYSVMGVLVAQENKIPVLNDLDGKPILFDWAELHIYASDLLNKAGHVVSVTYTSKKLVLHEIVGDLLILSYDVEGQFNETFMVKITDELVLNYQQQEEMAYQ